MKFKWINSDLKWFHRWYRVSLNNNGCHVYTVHCIVMWFSALFFVCGNIHSIHYVNKLSISSAPIITDYYYSIHLNLYKVYWNYFMQNCIDSCVALFLLNSFVLRFKINKNEKQRIRWINSFQLKKWKIILKLWRIQ